QSSPSGGAHQPAAGPQQHVNLILRVPASLSVQNVLAERFPAAPFHADLGVQYRYQVSKYTIFHERAAKLRSCLRNVDGFGFLQLASLRSRGAASIAPFNRKGNLALAIVPCGGGAAPAGLS